LYEFNKPFQEIVNNFELFPLAFIYTKLLNQPRWQNPEEPVAT